MERYEEYKDSGIEWLGDIPAHWDVLPINYLFKEETRINENLGRTLALKFSAGSIVPKPEQWDIDDVGETYAKYRMVDPGAIIVNNLNLNFDLKSLRVGRVEQPGIITSAYVAIIPSKTVEARYAEYALKAWDYKKAFHNMGKGLRLTLDWNELKRHQFVVPSNEEQVAIADFLDAETAEIDSLIEGTEKSIKLLEEYRKSVISEAVTKGLDSNVPMKDSGIKWIGEIPAHWKVSKVKYELINHDNLRMPVEASLRNQSAEVLYPYYGASGIVDYIDDYIFDGRRILIGEDGANLVLRNLPLVYVADGKYWVNNHAHILEPGKHLDFDYAALQLELIDLTDYITGSAQPKLSQANLGSIPIVIPSLDEQGSIVRSIADKSGILGRAIESRKELLEKLGQYRKSLISETVTGKIKVTEVK